MQGTVIGQFGGGVGSGIKLLARDEQVALNDGHITEQEAEMMRCERDHRAGVIATGMFVKLLLKRRQYTIVQCTACADLG